MDTKRTPSALDARILRIGLWLMSAPIVIAGCYAYFIDPAQSPGRPSKQLVSALLAATAMGLVGVVVFLYGVWRGTRRSRR